MISFLDFYISDLPLQFGGLNPEENKIKDDPIERDLYLSLDDIFHGCTKKIKISRKVSKPTLFLWTDFTCADICADAEGHEW